MTNVRQEPDGFLEMMARTLGLSLGRDEHKRIGMERKYCDFQYVYGVR